MNHRNNHRKLGRRTAHRKALFANLAKSLIQHEQITTTLAKAKSIRPIVERLITLGKKGNLAARRLVVSRLGGNTPQVSKLFEVLAKRYEERPGGYTRIIKYGYRKGDAAPRAVIEFVDRDEDAKGSA